MAVLAIGQPPSDISAVAERKRKLVQADFTFVECSGTADDTSARTLGWVKVTVPGRPQTKRYVGKNVGVLITSPCSRSRTLLVDQLSHSDSVCP
jgi:hypothetical protein